MSDEPNPSNDENIPQVNSGDNVRASWPFSLHDVRSNLAHCTAEGREVLIAAFLWCIDPAHPVTKPEFAAKVGYSDNLIYRLFTGKYANPDTHEKYDIPEKLIRATRDFLALERERFLGGKNEFVLTPTARRIFTACDLGRESQTPVFMKGVSHIGKTWALEYYSATNNHGRSPYVRMKAASGLGGMVKRISSKLGISDKANTLDLVDRIKRALTANTLLILDEMHLLTYTYRRESFFACLEVIREIYDETQCGMLFSFTPLLLEKVGEATQGELIQFLNRGVHRVTLPTMPTKDDLTAIFQHWGLEFPVKGEQVKLSERGSDGKVVHVIESPYELVRQLAKQSALKAITERLRYARKLAAKQKTKLAWEHFVGAHMRIMKNAQETADWE